MIDYAGGIGSLARVLKDYYDIFLPVYEEYMDGLINDGRVCYIKKQDLKTYEVVLNSAMLEHITRREHLEHINSLVKEDGVLILHTVVRQNIPKDPNWFYISPVHCAFHTNDSMQILMDDWGYTHSLYSPISKSWVWFKKGHKYANDAALESFSEKINKELQMKYFFYSRGFMGYWRD